MKSQYKGLVYTPGFKHGSRVPRWKVQISIAGKLRYLGYYEDEREAAHVRDNALIYLQEYFRAPLDCDNLNFPDQEITGYPMRPVVRLLGQLQSEGAPTYPHGLDETPDQEMVRVVTEAIATLEQRLVALRAALKRFQDVPVKPISFSDNGSAQPSVAVLDQACNSTQ